MTTQASAIEKLSVRRAVATDAERLAAFAERSFVEQFGVDNTPENMREHVGRSFGPALQHAELVDPAMVTLVGEIDGALVAFAQLRRGAEPDCVTGPSPIELYRFYVDRPWHGSGIARRLMGSVDDAARAQGGRTLWLGVWEHNPRAIAFYTKAGFVDVGSQPFMLGADPQTDRVMARNL